MPQTYALIGERLARVEEKIDTLISKAIDNHERLDAHEVRIRILENARARFLGAGAIMATLGGMFGASLFERVLN